jgi:CPA2 family monovalent cation:H+ antiporter-2
MFTLAVLAVALGIAFASSAIFGVSLALGAFLAGAVVGETDLSHKAAADALPLRDAFAVLFFVSVGMLLDPASMFATPGMLALTLGVILIVKPLSALAITRLFGYPLRVGLSIAVALAQIGEFSFIVASLGGQLGVFENGATDLLVASAIISIVLNPILYRLIDPVAAWLGRRSAGAAPPAREREETEPAGAQFRAVVVGYGPIGRTVARLLQENHIEPTIVDLNLATVRELQANGMKALYGDAARIDTLVNAGVPQARSFILSVAGMTGTVEAIRLARSLNPRIQILVRTAYLREVPSLRAAGADVVLSGEGEVALALAESMLQRLGATPEQIERERARVHSELG